MGNGTVMSSTSHKLEPLAMIPNVSLPQTVHPPQATGVPCKVVRWLASVEELSFR